MLETVAGWLLVVAFIKLFLFQLALAFGAKWGELAYGGSHTGRLPKNLRIISVFSSLVAIALAGHYLAELGVFESLLDSQGRSIANWAFFAFLAAGAVLNNISRSAPERKLWGPITLVMAVSALIIAL
ncbi:MAG: hypothetical protein RI590_00180 [Microbacteriaceae bacterium]|jgi:hypothetical protein|nr:hypothetical protein [Microbacteriaceae bacterium]MDR9443830.1 hypothetical protein [Microbacteriaceae bacterium]